MLADLRRAVLGVAVLTLLLGVLYPVLVTAVAQPLFGAKADGDPRLIGRAPDDPRGRFLPRPSATDHDATATAFANAGPNDDATRDATAAAIAAYAQREGVRPDQVPNDAAQTSASGIDPDISPRNARLQARRVARERGLPEATVLRLVDDHTDGRLLGVLGEPTVNLHDLNAAVEAAAR